MGGFCGSWLAMATFNLARSRYNYHIVLSGLDEHFGVFSSSDNFTLMSVTTNILRTENITEREDTSLDERTFELY